MFSRKKNIQIGDLVAVVGTVKQPPTAIGHVYLDQLTQSERDRLYKVISINKTHDRCDIEPLVKNKDSRKNFCLESLILVKENRPKISAEKLRID